jgi:pimeloyl-ACP methyl ester carboxylesterase
MVEMVLIQGEQIAVNILTPETHIGDVVMVHGFTGCKEDFDFMAPHLLKAGYRVIAADNRGAYQSAHSLRSDAYTIDSMARDVNELVEKFEIDRPHLFGHSLGGVIAQYAAASSPKAFQSITIMCSGPSAMAKPNVPANVIEMVRGKSAQESWDSEVYEMQKDHPRFELMQKRWLASDCRALESLGRELNTFTSVLPVIAESKLPAHVIYGDRDDAWPLAIQNQMALDLSAPVTVIKDAGHCPNEDQPEATVDAMVKFWKSISA